MIFAATSPEVGLAAGIASMLTPLLRRFGLRTMLATEVVGTMEASVTPKAPMTEVVEEPMTAT